VEERSERGEMGRSMPRPIQDTEHRQECLCYERLARRAAVFQFGFQFWENPERNFPGQQLCG